METYRCAYRDPHSPLTPLTPVCDVTLRENLRDHSPSLMPINKIELDECPRSKRKRSAMQARDKKSPHMHKQCPVSISVSSEKAPEEATKSSYLHSLRRILTPNLRRSPKSIDLAPLSITKVPSSENKRSRFTCFQRVSSDALIPMSPRVLRILQDIGQEKYTDVFRKEEIDLEVFKMLTKHDLIKLGIQEEKDISVILKAVRLVTHW